MWFITSAYLALYTPARFLEAENGWQAMDRLQEHPDIDVILLDIQMAGINGIDTLREIRKRGLRVPVVILTQFEERSLAENARLYGISGFLVKNSEPEELKRALEVAVKGGVYYNDLLTKSAEGGLTPNLALSSREMDVIRLLAAELTSAEIARQLNVSVETVITHRKKLLEKTKTRNVAELIGLAGKTGLL
ncbi:MAG: response regulator [Cyclobacteriaceae bacterium]|nr:response regulator transcription factor [Flammeovirgaceae bacterium]